MPGGLSRRKTSSEMTTSTGPRAQRGFHWITTSSHLRCSPVLVTSASPLPSDAGNAFAFLEKYSISTDALLMVSQPYPV